MSVEIFDGCDVCGGDHETENCPELGYSDTPASQTLSRARLTLPHFVEVKESQVDQQQVGVFATQGIAIKTRLGPYEARKTTQNIVSDYGFVLKVLIKDGTSVSLDTTDENECNWLCLIQAATTKENQNCMAIQIGTEIFYSLTKDILPGDELMVWYAPHYARKLGKPPEPDQKTKVLLGLYLAQELEPPFPAEADLTDLPEETDPAVFAPSPKKSLPALHNTLKTTKQKRRNQDCPCPECQMVFPTQFLLDQHRVIHRSAVKTEGFTDSAVSVMNDQDMPEKGCVDQPQDVSSPTAIEEEDTFGKISEDTAKALSTLTDPRLLHVKYKPGQEGAFNCSFCEHTYEDMQTLAKHVQQHLLQIDNQKREKSAGRSRTSFSNKRGRPKSGKNKKIIISDDDDDDDNFEAPKTYKRVKLDSNQTSKTLLKKNSIDGNPRQSSRIKAGMQSGKIVLSTRIKNELMAEEDNDTGIVTIKKSSSTEAKKSVLPTPGKRGRGRPRKYPVITETGAAPEVVVLDLGNETEQPEEQTASTSQEVVGKTAPSETQIADITADTLPEGSALEPCQVPLQADDIGTVIRATVKPPSAIVTDLEPGSGEVTISIPDVQTTSSSANDALLAAIYNLDDIDIMQKDSTEEGKPEEIPGDTLSKSNIEGATPSGDTVSNVEDTCPAEELPSVSKQTDKNQQLADINQPTEGINQSSVGIDQPSVGIDQPTVDIDQPSVDIDQIPVDTDKLPADIDQRSDGTGQPAGGIDQASDTTNQPLDGTDQPSDGTGQPSDSTGQPSDGTDQPSDGTGQPSDGTDQPSDSTDQPSETNKVKSAPMVKKEIEREEGEIFFQTAEGQFTCSGCQKPMDTMEELSTHKCDHPPPKRVKKEPQEAVVLHSCGVCSKSFEKESYLKRHMEGHELSLKCDDCGKVFLRKVTLKTHVCPAKTTAKEGPAVRLFCDFCGQSFANERYLARHMSAHTGEFACSKCNRTFARKESLLYHMKKCDPKGLKSGADQQGFPCQLCNKVFGREVTLQNHMALHNEEFKCEMCAKAFSSSVRLKNHDCIGVKLDPDGDVFPCLHEGCGKTFSRELYLARHMTIHTGQYSCVICSRRYARKEELIKHMLECTASVQVETMGEIVCTVCNKKFADAPSFRTHFQEHTHPYKCNDCGRMFLRKTNYESHLERCVPWDGEPVVCKKCEKKFKSPLFLQRHSVVHEEPKYHCKVCGKKFHRLDYYNDHMCLDPDGQRVRIKRTRKKTEICNTKPCQICPTCGKSYVSSSNLNKHMMTHGEKTEECSICNKKFHLKMSLKEHMKMVHTDQYNFQCPHCGKRLKCRNSMYGHIAQFHGKTLTLYQCHQCNKHFKQKGNLKKHMLIHSDKKTFTCKFCAKTFKFPEQIRRHELLHTEGHRFKCDLCEKTFLMEFEKRKHMDTHHGGTVYVCKYCLTDCHHFHTMKRHLARRHYSIMEWQSDTTSFINSLIKNNESEEYLAIKKVREQNGELMLAPAFSILRTDAVAPEQTQIVTGQPLAADSIVQEADTAQYIKTEGGQVINPETGQALTDKHLIISQQPDQDPDSVNIESKQDTDTVFYISQSDLDLANLSADIGNLETPTSLEIASNSLSGVPGLSLPDESQGPLIVAEIQQGGAAGQNQTFIIHSSGFEGFDSDSLMSKEVAQAIQSLSNSGAFRGDQPTMIQIGDIICTQEMINNGGTVLAESSAEQILQSDSIE